MDIAVGGRDVFPKVTIGDRLRRLRRAHGLDQRAFAEEVDVSKSLVAKAELLDCDPPNPRLLLLSVRARFGGQVAHWLETGCEDPVCPHSDSNRKPTDYKVVAPGVMCVARCVLPVSA